MIYDFYTAANTWLDSCDANEFAPSRLLAILSALYGDVRMVVRGEVADAVAAEEDFAEWLFNV